jgi:manganese oxidase
LSRLSYLQVGSPPEVGAIVPFTWSKVMTSGAIHDLQAQIDTKDVTLAAIPDMDDYGTYDTVIPGSAIHERTMFWQDGLNLWDGRRRPYFKGGCSLKDGEISCANDSYVGGPIPDCPACDDSYDWGEKGVNYSSAPLFARVRNKDVSYWKLSENDASLGEEAIVRLPKRLGPNELRSLCGAPVYFAGDDPSKEICGSEMHITSLKNSLGAWPLPATLFSSTWLEPLPLPLIIAMPADSEVSLRIIAQQGRARQRAFVPIGMSYADIFPGFGSGHTSLLAPGKTLNAALGTPPLTGDYMWFDGPRQHVDGGAWGLLRIIPK